MTHNTGLHSEWLLNSSCTVLSLGPMPQKLAVPYQIKKILLPFPALWISSVLQLLFSLISLHPFSGPLILSVINAHLHLWKFTTWKFVCWGLAVRIWIYKLNTKVQAGDMVLGILNSIYLSIYLSIRKEKEREREILSIAFRKIT